MPQPYDVPTIAPGPIPTDSPLPSAQQSELSFYQGLFQHFVSFQGWNQQAMMLGDQIGACVLAMESALFVYLLGKDIFQGQAPLLRIFDLVFKMLMMTILLAMLSFTPTVGQKVASIPCQLAMQFVGESAVTIDNSAAGTVDDCTVIAQPFGLFKEGIVFWNAVTDVKLPDGNGGWFSWLSDKVHDVVVQGIMYTCAGVGFLALWILGLINLIVLAIFNASIPICAIFLPLMLFQFLAHMGRNVLTYLFTSAELLFGFYLGCTIGIALVVAVVNHLQSLANPQGTSVVGLADLGLWGVIGPAFVLLMVVAEVVVVMWLVYRVAKGSPFSPEKLAAGATRFAAGGAMTLGMAGIGLAAASASGGSWAAKAGAAKAGRGLSKFTAGVARVTQTQRAKSSTIVERLRDRMRPPREQQRRDAATKRSRDQERQGQEQRSQRQPSSKPPKTEAQPSAAESTNAGSATSPSAGDTANIHTDSMTSAASQSPSGAVDRPSPTPSQPGTTDFGRIASPIAPSSSHKQDDEQSLVAESQRGESIVERHDEVSGTEHATHDARRETVDPVVSRADEESRPGENAPSSTGATAERVADATRPVNRTVLPVVANVRRGSRPTSPGERSRLDAAMKKVRTKLQAPIAQLRRVGGEMRRGHHLTNLRKNFGRGYNAMRAFQQHWDDGALIFDGPAQALVPETRPKSAQQFSEMSRTIQRLQREIEQQKRAGMQMRPPAASTPPASSSYAPDHSTSPAPQQPARPARSTSQQGRQVIVHPDLVRERRMKKPKWVLEHERELRAKEPPSDGPAGDQK